MHPFFLLEPGDGLVLCGASGHITHVDRCAQQRLGHQAQEWCGQPIRDCWPELADLVVQEHRRLAEGARDHVLALPHPTGVELATRVRLFASDSGVGVGVLRRRAQRLDAEPEAIKEWKVCSSRRDAMLAGKPFDEGAVRRAFDEMIQSLGYTYPAQQLLVR